MLALWRSGASRSGQTIKVPQDFSNSSRTHHRLDFRTVESRPMTTETTPAGRVPATDRTAPPDGVRTTPERPIDTPAIRARLAGLLADCGADLAGREGRLLFDLASTVLKLPHDGRDTGELKLLTNSFKELRHALRVFAPWREQPKVSIFGSARTPAGHPDYAAAVATGELFARHGWLTITGAGDGIMKAGHEGSGRESAFGLAIRLPFETTANSIISGDTKLINFRYFFTRKTMFLSQSAAVVALPGGFGTQDEVLETLTLIQTGKSAIVPVVLLAGGDGDYWHRWDDYVRGSLQDAGFIGPHDCSLYHLAADPLDAVEHVLRFYAVYHSMRYVGDDVVIRLRRPLSTRHVDLLAAEFADVVATGTITQRGVYEAEREHPELPRIAFTHTRRDLARVRLLIDRINDYGIAEDDPAGC